MQSISVIIPAYNSGKYIKAAIDSVLIQSYKPLEIIIIDDGSTDNTETVIRSYGDKVVYCHQENAGSGKARNTGIKLAKGDWIAFLDSDDYWYEDHLKKLIARLSTNKKADMVYGAQRYVHEDGTPCAEKHQQDNFPEGWIFADMFEANYVSTPAVVVRRSLLQQLGGFSESPSLRNGQDNDLWLRISANSLILSEPDVVFDYRRHSNNRTLDHRNMIKGRLAALNNAVRLIKSGRVNSENQPEKIKVKTRMIALYRQSIRSLFFMGDYNEARAVGFEALGKNYGSGDLLVRTMLSCLPHKALAFAKTTRRKNI